MVCVVVVVECFRKHLSARDAERWHPLLWDSLKEGTWAWVADIGDVMKASEVFGLIVRVIGLIVILAAVSLVAYGIIDVATWPLLDVGMTCVELFRIVLLLVVGLLLLLRARWVVWLAYPTKRERQEHREEDT